MNIVSRFIGIILFAYTPLASAQEFQHTTNESYYLSGYDYYWSVLQDEFDQLAFETDAESEEYFNLVDTFVRIGTGHGHSFKNISLGITQIYPKLLELDPDPPLYTQYHFHSAVFQRKSTPEQDLEIGKAMLDIAIRMRDANYPPYFEGSAWLRAAHILSSVGLKDDEETIAARKTGLDLIIKAASLEGIEPQNREFVATKICGFGYNNRSFDIEQKEQFAYLLFTDEQTDQWIANNTLGHLMVEKAWNARSRARAYKINDAQWEMFYLYLSVANNHLTTAWEIRPQWPKPASKMIAVTMGNQFHSQRDEYFWFEQATATRPDHNRAYTNLTRAILPKWGGSTQQLYALLDHIIEISQIHQHMSYIYLHVMGELSKLTNDPYEVLLSNHYRAHATRMLKDEIESPLANINPWTTREDLNAIAMANFMAKDYQTATELLKGGGAQAWTRRRPWKTESRFFRYNRLLATFASDEIIAALQASDEGNLDEALEIIKQVKIQLQEDPERTFPHIFGDPRKYIDSLIMHIEMHNSD